MAFRDAIQSPDLPALEREALPRDGELVLSGALVEPDGGGSVGARRVRVRESELRGVTLAADNAPGRGCRGATRSPRPARWPRHWGS